MSSLVWSVLFFFILLPLSAQEIDWNKVNSNTVFNIITEQNAGRDLYHSSVIQIGDYNNAELFLNAKSNVDIRQLGDYNTLYFINSFTDKETKTSVTTQGNNNIVDITGSNSISEGMQVNVKGDNRTIFMRNY